MTRDNAIFNALETAANWWPVPSAVIIGKVPKHTRGSFVYARFQWLISGPYGIREVCQP